MRKPLENLFRFSMVAAGFAIVMWMTAWIVRPPLEQRALPYTPEQIAALIKERTAGLPVTDMYGWSDYPGMPDELVDRHIELTFTELAPLLR